MKSPAQDTMDSLWTRYVPVEARAEIGVSVSVTMDILEIIASLRVPDSMAPSIQPNSYVPKKAPARLQTFLQLRFEVPTHSIETVFYAR